MQAFLTCVRLFLLILLTSQIGMGQSSLKKANKFLQKGKYELAFQQIENLKGISKNKSALATRGICQYHLNKLTPAAKDLSKAFELGNKDPELKYYMGLINHHKRNYKEAIYFYKEYLRDLKSSEELRPDVALQIKHAFSGLRSNYSNNDLGLVENAGNVVNTKYDEINPIPSPNFLNRYYYSSNIAQDNFDLFGAEMMQGKWMQGDFIHASLNTDDDEILQDCSLDGSVLVFLRGDGDRDNKVYLNRYSANTHRQRVLFSEVKGITGDKDIYLINDEMMIFSSKREGGFGGYDLYSSEFTSKGWTKPRNLGSEVNSAFDERYPFINEENNHLFFSSNRTESIGGFDIFSISKMDGNWGELNVYNYPLNSPADEIQYRVQESGHQAYFASNRKTSGEGGFDIYSMFLRKEFKVHSSEPKAPLALIKSSVRDDSFDDIVVKEKDQEEIPSSVDSDKETMEELAEIPTPKEKTNAEEAASTTQESMETETVETEIVETENVETENVEANEELEEASAETMVNENIEEEEEEEEATQEVIVEKTVEEINEPDVIIEESKKTKEQEELVEEAVDDSTKEEINTALEESNELAGIDDMIQPEKEEPKKSINKKKSKKEKSKKKSNNASSDPIILAKDEGNKISIAPIIYENDGEIMNERNLKVMDALVNTMIEDKMSKVILICHSNPEGLPEFELMFAIRRAEMISDYLIDNGIKEKRILLKGVGSAYPYVKKILDDKLYNDNKKYNNRIDLKLVNTINSFELEQPSMNEKLLNPAYELFETVTRDVYFRVRIHETEKKMYKNAILRYYNDLLIERNLVEGKYKYHVGLYTDFKKIFELKRELENRNIENAEIIAFYNGMELSNSDAKLLKDEYPELVNFLEIDE